jgi:hypothetical protein
MASAEIRENVLRLINDRNRREDEQEFDRWCEYLASLPAGLEFMPKGNFEADIELQPLRWMSLGIDLIQSSKVTARLELAGGDKGPPISSYLPYPVFQLGAEIFLKGMWLCRHLDCRQLTDSSYVDPATRKKYRDELGGLSHDLLKIISETRKIPECHDDASTMRSLDLVERIIRRFYFPPYKAKQTNEPDGRIVAIRSGSMATLLGKPARVISKATPRQNGWKGFSGRWKQMLIVSGNCAPV